MIAYYLLTRNIIFSAFSVVISINCYIQYLRFAKCIYKLVGMNECDCFARKVEDAFILVDNRFNKKEPIFSLKWGFSLHNIDIYLHCLFIYILRSPNIGYNMTYLIHPPFQYKSKNVIWDVFYQCEKRVLHFFLGFEL